MDTFINYEFNNTPDFNSQVPLLGPC